jgi:threonine/homoserine/homoserine lactone efflux protein
MITTFLTGIALGLSIAAPVGPIGVLCIRRTLTNGRLTGFISGMGAAVADALYGALAAFGLSAVMNFLTGLHLVLHLGGSLFLIYLGITIARSRPRELHDPRPLEREFHNQDQPLAHNQDQPLERQFHNSDRYAQRNRMGSFWGAFLSAFGLTLCNPMTIMSFTAIFAGLNIPPRSELAIVSGVFLGSTLWWLILSGVVGWVKPSPDKLVWVNRFSALIIVGCGILGLTSL